MMRNKIKSVKQFGRGISASVVKEISSIKNEPKWMLEFRLSSLSSFFRKEIPKFGPDLSAVNFDELVYYIRPSDKKSASWSDVPESIRTTFEKLGVPEAERKFLGGLGAQYDSETVYHNLRKELKEKGIIFTDTDSALREHESLFRKYFASVVKPDDNKFSALNSAVWSGGSFVYIPKGVKVDIPLQAYFRINAQSMGQFERTLIIVDEGASVNYVEGCTAPIYSSASLHCGVVEVVALRDSKVRYTTIQNWSNNVFNLVTKRAHAHENAVVEWLDGNLGCLTGDTKIFLNSNVKSISDIEAGDMVFAADNNFELNRYCVNNKEYSGKQKVYRMRTLNHREIKATANHPFLAIQKKGKFSFASWVPLENIKSADLVAISGDIPESGKPLQISFTKVGKKQFSVPHETTEDLMWLMGLYLGDGYCDRNRVYFAVPEKDKACPKLVHILKYIFGLEGERKGAVLRIASVDFVKFIKETLGFFGNARSKRIPRWVFGLPKEQRLTVITGYIAADGYFRENHKNISITSCNKSLLEDVKTLAMTCGLNPMKISMWTRREKKPLGKEEKEYTHYFLYFGEARFDRPIAFVPVAEIQYCGEEDTWDIEVEGAHNFVANGFIVHNSKVTMKYPGIHLLGRNAKADVLSVSFAGKSQHQDVGSRVLHLAPDTSSKVVSKSISKDGGISSYRGLLRVAKGARNTTASMRCDALMLDSSSRSDTYPSLEVNEDKVSVSHEAAVGRIGEDKLFYLMSRGLSEQQAVAMIVMGFISDFTMELPMEYAVELNRLVQLEISGHSGKREKRA